MSRWAGLAGAVTPLFWRGAGGEVIRCPLDDGFGVYMARAALIGIEGVGKPYINECERSPMPEGLDKGRPSGNTEFITLYPNPANGALTLEFVIAAETVASIQITDLTGRVLMNKQVATTSNSLSLDVSYLAVGYYLLTMKEKGANTHTVPFSISR